MKFLVLSLLVVAAVASPAFRGSSADETQFKQWMNENTRNYESIEEYMKRFSIWVKNREEIAKVNSAQNDFELRLNQFADIDSEEFRFYYTGYQRAQLESTQEVTLPTDDLPASVDWTTKGAVTGVKNQGQCGSCWSFSTTGSLEGLHFLKKGSLLSFSEQQLVDCSGSFGNQGCNGGLMDDAFKYVESKGIELESDYPYTAADGKCAYDASKVQFTNTGYADVPTKNEMQLKAAVAKQPVSVAVDGASLAFQFYFGGVVSYFCGTSLDHGVLAVGYGTDSGKDFWKVKNSWGGSWGESGYIRLRRYDKNDDGTCGIAMQPSYPTLS